MLMMRFREGFGTAPETIGCASSISERRVVGNADSVDI